MYEGTTYTPVETYARDFVMDHIYHGGRRHDLLGDSRHYYHLYNKIADGFGPGMGNSLDYDWSHFRDSTGSAFIEMANYILWNIYGVARQIKWFFEYDYSPLAVPNAEVLEKSFDQGDVLYLADPWGVATVNYEGRTGRGEHSVSHYKTGERTNKVPTEMLFESFAKASVFAVGLHGADEEVELVG